MSGLANNETSTPVMNIDQLTQKLADIDAATLQIIIVCCTPIDFTAIVAVGQSVDVARNHMKIRGFFS